MTKIRLQFDDQIEEFQVTHQGNDLYIEQNGRTVNCRLTTQEDGHFILELIEPDGSRRQIRAAGWENGEERQLWVNGRTVTYQRVRQRRGRADNESSLSATIPAIVTQVLVSPGDLVSPGEKLILLESMKMIIPIHAPYAGRVRALNCVEGDSVQAGVQLIELEREKDHE
jgi:biotin carboxyl carrier protein